MKILIVEDDFTCRMMMQRLLEPYGKCDVVINGKEAVEAFIIGIVEGKPYDLILLDIMMPEMDGQEVVKRSEKLKKRNGESSIPRG